MDWKDNIGTIKEIYPGHYQIILDFATNLFVEKVLDESYKYVWVHKHQLENPFDWHSFNLPLINENSSNAVLARQLMFDFALPTKEFRNLLPKLSSGINLILLNELPKYYLDPAIIKGKTRYDLLKNECDYLFEIDIPSATDYGTLISSDRGWLESLLNDINIDWNNLP